VGKSSDHFERPPGERRTAAATAAAAATVFAAGRFAGAVGERDGGSVVVRGDRQL
jgi:hypothetical protein